jgi:hypothetical protein
MIDAPNDMLLEAFKTVIAVSDRERGTRQGVKEAEKDGSNLGEPGYRMQDGKRRIAGR